MRIAVIGRGNVGGGLACLWRAAGHTVDAFGRDGGDASAADVLVVAVPDHAIPSALAQVSGVAGKPAIDATNPDSGRPAGFPSLAHLVKSLTGGPIAKAFDTVFAAQHEEIASTRPAPSCLWSGDDQIAELPDPDPRRRPRAHPPRRSPERDSAGELPLGHRPPALERTRSAAVLLPDRTLRHP